MRDTVNIRAGNAPMFNQIAIETASVCNRSCVFCPNHDSKRPDEYMPWEFIEKTTQELKAMRWVGRWMPYSYNEPTRDSRQLEIIRYVRKELPGTSIILDTNCDYFKTKEDLLAYYEAGATQMILNIYSAADGCGNPVREAKGVTAAEKRMAQVQQWVADLGLELGKDMYGIANKGARRALVNQKFGLNTESQKIGKFELQNTSGNIDWIPPAVEPLKKMCVRPWRSMNVNWKGDAILCCNDYHGDVVLGNVADHTIMELWNSDKMNRYRLHLQQKDRHMPLCDTCDYSGGYYQHMIQPITFGSDKEDAKQFKAIRNSIPMRSVS